MAVLRPSKINGRTSALLATIMPKRSFDITDVIVLRVSGDQISSRTDYGLGSRVWIAVGVVDSRSHT